MAPSVTALYCWLCWKLHTYHFGFIHGWQDSNVELLQSRQDMPVLSKMFWEIICSRRKWSWLSFPECSELLFLAITTNKFHLYGYLEASIKIFSRGLVHWAPHFHTNWKGFSQAGPWFIEIPFYNQFSWHLFFWVLGNWLNAVWGAMPLLFRRTPTSPIIFQQIKAIPEWT